MSNIFIDGLNSKTGGGKVILDNYLTLLKESNAKNHFFVLTPSASAYLNYECDFIKIVDIKKIYKKNIFFPFINHFLLPRLLKEFKIDVIFNLADIVIPTDIPQVYLFDWPYAVYPESSIWNNMDFKSFCERKLKLLFFKNYIKGADAVIAQTNTMKRKLEALYDLQNVTVIPNGVSLGNMTGGEYFNFNLPTDRFKCLYLTYYYSHKNLEVFIPLAKMIKSANLPYSLIVTISPQQHKKAAEFLSNVQRDNLDDIIVNVGPVPMSYVPSLYKQSDAMLMPTLLETFGLPYMEAMYHNKPIMTSNLDFALDVCGEAASYFDPLDVESILNTINDIFQNESFRLQNIEHGKTKLAQMLNWQQTFSEYQRLLEYFAQKS